MSSVVSMDYYGRKPATFVDGTQIFVSKEDEDRQREVAAILEKRWRCEALSLGKLSPVDWVFIRDGRLVGLGELKTRSHAFGRYPTVFLNLRKWLALQLARSGMGVVAVFVVRFTDQLCWIPIDRIDSTRVIVGGCRQIVKSRNDIEPVIEIPCSTLMRVRS